MPARYQTIAKWVNKFGWTQGAELGVFDGRTHFFLLKRCPNLTLWGLDLWADSAPIEGATKSGERCFCDYCSETRAARKRKTITEMEADVMAKAALQPRSRIIRGHTVLSAGDVPNGLDFVFVDGDHSTEGVYADIDAWMPKISKGGRLIGHDYNMQSVRDAVLAHFAEDAVKTGDDHLWWVDV